MQGMILRRCRIALESALDRQPAVALLGPRQVGKTTLALQVASTRASIYLDLETMEDRRKLAEPELFLSRYEDHLVILDEIHRAPQIFAALRGLIDRGRRRGKRTGRFLLLGSASMDLLRQSGETLAGRIAYVQLGPFDILEAATARLDTIQLWSRGGFPDSFLAGGDGASFLWRKDFIRSYLEREIPAFGPRIPAEALERLWTMLAHNQATLLNASSLAQALMVSAQTVTRYIDLLADLLLVRRLPPFYSNAGKRIVKAPKTFIRDSGLAHALLGLRDFNQLSGHPVVGATWEGFAIENLLAAAPSLTQAAFYRTSAGAEIDLILEIPGHGIWAIDIKRGLSARPAKGFHIACEDLRPAKRWAVNSGAERYPIDGKTEAVGVLELAGMLAALQA